MSVSGSERGLMHLFSVLCAVCNFAWCEKLSKCFSYCFHNFVISDAMAHLLLLLLLLLLFILRLLLLLLLMGDGLVWYGYPFLMQ